MQPADFVCSTNWVYIIFKFFSVPEEEALHYGPQGIIYMSTCICLYTVWEVI